MWVRLLVSSRVFRSTPPVRGETRRSFRPAARPRWRSPPLPPPLRNQTAGPAAPSCALVLQLVNSCRFSRHSITPRRAHVQPRPLLMSSRKRRIRSSTRVFPPRYSRPAIQCTGSQTQHWSLPSHSYEPASRPGNAAGFPPLLSARIEALSQPKPTRQVRVEGLVHAYAASVHRRLWRLPT